MRWVYKSTLVLYIIALGFGVFTPRPDLVGPNGTPIGHQILYLGGFWAWVGNFLMLIPVAYIIHICWPKLFLQTIFITCLTTTISIEFMQLYIPGRVSDVRDIALNSTGAALTLLVLHWHKTSKSRAQ